RPFYFFSPTTPPPSHTYTLSLHDALPIYGAITGGQWDHSDSVLKLSPTLRLEDAFAPTTWGPENANDEDLGSQGPVLLPNNFILDRKSTRLNSSHVAISYAVFCLKKKKHK